MQLVSSRIFALQKSAHQIEPDALYERPAFMNAFRLFGFVLLTTLNISLIGGLISRLSTHHKLNWLMEGESMLFLLFADVVFLVPILLEIRKVRVWPDYIIINTLLWQSKLASKDVVLLKNIENLTFYMLKTKRMVYMIGKRDFRRSEDLAKHIQNMIEQEVAQKE
jgi:hypothetical protein